jgi:hypothetical protein
MTLSLRMKALIGLALAIGAFVVFAPAPQETIDAAPSDSRAAGPDGHARGSSTGSRAARPSPGQSAMHALALLAHRVSDSAAAGALFASQSWYTPPPPPPAPPPAPEISEAQAAALRTPTAPPLPFTYMGSYAPNGTQPVFFLTQGDRVYDVRVGDTLDNTYSIDEFNNGQLTLTYRPLNVKQQLKVGGSP